MAETTECWEWAGPVNADGYGETRQGVAHRVAYEAYHGGVPAGLVVDHVCHNQDLECPGGPSCRHRRCVNPDHLEAVSRLANAARARQGGVRVHRATTRQRGTTRQGIRIPDELLEQFGEACGQVGTDRAAVVRALIRWWLGQPGAKVPDRPTPPVDHIP